MMKKNFFLMVYLVLTIFIFNSCVNKKGIRKKEKNRASFEILKQKKREREFYSKKLTPIKEIKFYNLKEEIYFPKIIKFGDLKNIYIYDFKTKKIHHLLFGENLTLLNHTIFRGRSLKGKGPGELTRVLDFKIYKDKIYILDEGTNSVSVYSKGGEFIKNIKVFSGEVLLFRALTFQNGKLILASYKNGNIFYYVSQTGKIIKSFGKYIDKNYPDNPLYHQYYLSEPFGEDSFYYMPIYLGFVGKYKGMKLSFAKETIDGRRYPEFISENIDGAVVTRMKGLPYMTVSSYAIGENIILIKTFDFKKSIAFWDFYTLEDFNYIISIKNPPSSYAFDIRKNFLICTDDESIKFFDIRNLFSRSLKKKPEL